MKKKSSTDLKKIFETLKQNPPPTIPGLQEVIRLIQNDPLQNISDFRRKYEEISFDGISLKNNPIPDEEEDVNYRGIVLLHYHWSKHDPTMAISLNNKRKWSKKYGINEQELWEKWKLVVDIDKSTLNLMHNDNSIRETIKQYQLIIPFLEQLCPDSVPEANKQMNILKNRLKKTKIVHPGITRVRLKDCDKFVLESN